MAAPARRRVARTVPWLGGALLAYDVLDNAYHSLPEDKPGTPVDEKRAAELERAAQEGERRIETAKAAGGDDEAEGLRRQQAFIAGQAGMIKALHNDPFGRAKAPEAEIKGNADVNVNVKLEPTPDFWTRVTTAVSNGINSLHINGTAPTGTTGATGRSMPEAAPGSP